MAFFPEREAGMAIDFLSVAIAIDDRFLPLSGGSEGKNALRVVTEINHINKIKLKEEAEE